MVCQMVYDILRELQQKIEGEGWLSDGGAWIRTWIGVSL